jgi:hypothetical protein
MSVSDSQAGVSLGTGIADNDYICINGEWAKVLSGGGTSVLTLMRFAPVAHAKYEPVSKDFVGTYVLDNSGGNVNMGEFTPTRRAVQQDRWDFSINLLRAVP